MTLPVTRWDRTAVRIALTGIALTAAILGAPLLVSSASAQVYVGPRRPGQSGVRYQHHDWQRVDLSMGDDDEGGVRLYFYEGERDVAGHAAAAITTAYDDLAADFGYRPERRFPYVLYSTYLDFLGTNVFPVQEGTLGVTSTQDLTIALPYFGDHRRFAHVSKHEMTHEFTIQKVRAAAREAGASRDPLAIFPLWFIEGLAEYYANDGVPGETAMLGRDLVTNADIRRYFGPLDFFDDAPGSVLWTYQVGHLRCVFLEEVYGEGTLQTLLTRSVESSTRGPDGTFSFRGFPGLVQVVTGDDGGVITRRFESWLRERTYTPWLDATTRPEDLTFLQHVRGYTLGLSASPDGELVATKAIDFETGRTKILLVHARDPRRGVRVAADDRPGAETLHPVEDHTVAVGDHVIAWSAESRGADVIVWRSVARDRHPRSGRHRPADGGPARDESRYRLHLGPPQRLRLRDHGLVGATGLSISPDGTGIAFVGLAPDGRSDVYTFRLADDGALTRLTDDVYAERDTAWGDDGVVYASDDTSHGFFNLFRAPSGGGLITRLTTAPQDHLAPTSRDGRVLFTAWDGERMDLYEVTPEGVSRRTRVTTALTLPSGNPDGAWALLQDGGYRRPVQVPDALWLDDAAAEQPVGAEAPPRPTRALDEATPYRPSDPRNWRIEQTLGYFGAGAGGVYGQLYLSARDHLRDHALLLSAAAFGNLRLSDGYLAYTDQSHRTTWAAGGSQSLRFRIDGTFRDLPFQSAERTYGLLGTVRRPLNRYTYLQADVSVGATQYFLLDGTDDLLRSRWNTEGVDYLSEWTALNGKARPQAEITARIGADTIRYHPTTGPHGGGSVLLEAAWAVQPFAGQGFGHVRLDAERYVPLKVRAVSGANVGLRVGAGLSGGGTYARSFFLSSFDTLRGVRFGDANHLLGRTYTTGTAELQVPLDGLLRVAILSSVEAVAAVDVGAVAARPEDLWDHRVADVVLGTNLIVGPLVFRVHFARPMDVGAPMPNTGGTAWVPNVSLRWLSL